MKINGVNVTFLGFRVENKTHFSADTWSVDLEPWGQPEGFDLVFFADSQNTTVEIQMGFLASGQPASAHPVTGTSLIIGETDDDDIRLLDGKLTISGRDYTARLIDTKTANKYPDNVASWIVTELAKQVGLTANATPTTTPAGQYYQSSYSSLTRDVPMWDLITFLAEQEGFDAYVTGTVLYFGPPQADSDTDPFSVKVKRDRGSIWSTAKDITLKRSETVAKDLSVTVLSHSYRTGKGVKAVANRAGTKAVNSTASNSKSSTQSYVIRRPNLTQEQAQQLATKTLLDLTKFEKTMDIVVEGDATMNVRRRVRLSGTGTSFDRDYYPNALTQTYEHRGKGYEMSISVKNHPTLSQVSTV